MAFLVIVTTSIRLSTGDCTVLICESVLVCIFKPEFSITHVFALAHFASQSGPAWHMICVGFDKPASRPPPPEQLQVSKRTHAISALRRRLSMRWPKTPAARRSKTRAKLNNTPIPVPVFWLSMVRVRATDFDGHHILAARAGDDGCHSSTIQKRVIGITARSSPVQSPIS